MAYPPYYSLFVILVGAAIFLFTKHFSDTKLITKNITLQSDKSDPSLIRDVEIDRKVATLIDSIASEVKSNFAIAPLLPTPIEISTRLIDALCLDSHPTSISEELLRLARVKSSQLTSCKFTKEIRTNTAPALRYAYDLGVASGRFKFIYNMRASEFLSSNRLIISYNFNPKALGPYLKSLNYSTVLIGSNQSLHFRSALLRCSITNAAVFGMCLTNRTKVIEYPQ